MLSALVANGEIKSYASIKKKLETYQKIGAVDGGLHHCKQMNILPDFILGDLDSISKETLFLYPNTPIVTLSTEKDESDLEVAILKMFSEGAQKISLFAATGKRTDHLLYNLQLLARFPGKLEILSEDEKIFCLTSKQKVEVQPGQTLSLIPLGEVTNVQSTGLKWEIQNQSLNKNFMSLSNISLNNFFTISFDSGDLICLVNI